MPLILIAIGLFLIIYNYHFIKKENISNNPSPFKNVLKENKDQLNDYKMELGILRRDIAESLTELQEEILDIKNSLNMVKKDSEEYENKEYIKNYDMLDEDSDINNIKDPNEYNQEISENEFLINSQLNNDVISEINFSKRVHDEESNKTESIKNLLQEGLTDEEICYKLSVSKGEVLLVKSLFRE